MKKIDVILIKDKDVEMVPNLRVEVDIDNYINIQNVISELKDLGFNLHKAYIKIKNNMNNQFEDLGQEPLLRNNYIIYNN